MKAAVFFIVWLVWASKLGGADGVLEPIYAFARDEDYFRAVHDTLIKPREHYWMIVLPSFSPEFAVVLKSRPMDMAPKKFQLSFEVVVAQKPIFGWENVGDGISQVRYDRTVSLNRVSKDIGQQDVDLLAEASFAAFSRMRVPEGPSGGLDGTTYLFCFDRYSGKAWTPRSGDAAALVEIWTAAREYVERTGEAEKEALFRFRAACAKIKNGPTRR